MSTAVVVFNWQCVAGTGTDANPHRVFNPTRQSERFDPDGVYIRRCVRELADGDAPMIHDPPDLDGPASITRRGWSITPK